jgi:hypothetical protein
LPPGSVGLDVGCGNGKYLGVNPEIFMIGSDRYSTPLHAHSRSFNLTKIVQERRFEVNVSDCLDIPAQNGRFVGLRSTVLISRISPFLSL